MARILYLARYGPAFKSDGTPVFFGGGETTQHDRMAALVRRGHSVGWFYSYGSAHPAGEYSGIRLYYCTEARTEAVVRRVVDDFGPDVVLTQNEGLGWFDWLPRSARKVTSVAYWSDILRRPHLMHRLWLDGNDLVPDAVKIMRAYDCVLANSQFTCYVLQQLGVHNVRLVEPHLQPALPYHRRERYAIMGYAKHAQHIVHELPALVPSRVWDIYPYDGTVRGRLPPNVAVQGWTEPAAIYSNARMLVFPGTLSESFCRAVADGLLNGIPAVHSGRGNLAGLVGDAGFLVPLDAPVSHWAEAIRWIERDYDEYQRRAYVRARTLQPDPLGTWTALIEGLVTA